MQGYVIHIVLVGGQTRMPMVQNAVAEYFGRRPHKGVNPDEVVGIGAAIQGNILVSDERDLLLLDVTPLDLGIATYNGGFASLIAQNTTVPVAKTHSFTTTRDDQSTVKIRVLQGSSNDRADNNHLLGEFFLRDIPSAAAGEPDIEVTFDIDVNGIVNVSAQDLATDTQQSITVSATGTLTDDEIANLMIEHEAAQLPAERCGVK